MLLSEGAGALLLTREGALELETIAPGGNFSRQSEVVRRLEPVGRALAANGVTDLLVASANGTFIDAAERATVAAHFRQAAIYTLKPALGESVAAGALWQVICAAHALQTQQLPPLLHAPEDFDLTTSTAPAGKPWRRAVVTTCGLNQQVAGLALRATS